MKQFTRKTLSVLLAVLMVLSVFAGLTAFAGDDDPADPAQTGYTEVKEVPATCTEPGCAAHYEDADGNPYLLVDGEFQPVGDAATLVLPVIPHDIKTVAATESTCAVVGHEACYQCKKCSKYFSDAEGENEIELSDIALPQPPHTLTKSDASAPTCNHVGYIEYWYCDVCKQYFRDADAATAISVNETIVPSLGHSFSVTERVDATCTGDGYAVYTCTRDGCGYSYTETFDKLDHVDADGSGYCDSCGRTMNPDACLLCGKNHTGTFGKIVRFFHHIIWTLLNM